MIRPARMVDVFAIVELLTGAHSRSRYAGAVAVDEAVARKTLAQFIQRHGGAYAGASCVFVSESGEGVIHSLVVGVLDRVYFIGDQLVAQDVFLVAAPDAPARASLALIDAYLGWASANPNVYEIQLSWTDALPSGERMPAIYERRGFSMCGGIYRRENIAEAAAA